MILRGFGVKVLKLYLLEPMVHPILLFCTSL
ncbi:hypothetical protein MEE_01166 [Bartonella elizabethae F9251 = ATCC 49927]|uniref:Uncharacterized protein n=1 Tax=Bartonella elizabethae F9251 = ATCC 49927 TaxID=1094555 RepID=J0R9G1_BAREL|nr:hypothetical protein MEE_01166 [Bartonella elizabethae F9251 = ATCC 49927]VEJ41657.1 Uncharacterised protein [Bartonella elizabethae]